MVETLENICKNKILLENYNSIQINNLNLPQLLKDDLHELIDYKNNIAEIEYMMAPYLYYLESYDFADLSDGHGVPEDFMASFTINEQEDNELVQFWKTIALEFTNSFLTHHNFGFDFDKTVKEIYNNFKDIFLFINYYY